MTIETDESGKKKGPWRDEARDFEQFQDAIRAVLQGEEMDSIWNLEIQVRKAGNPIHQYRVVLAPGT